MDHFFNNTFALVSWILSWKKSLGYHFVKSVQILSYFWSVFSCIQSECRKMQTRNNSVLGHFSRNVLDAFYRRLCLENTTNFKFTYLMVIQLLFLASNLCQEDENQMNVSGTNFLWAWVGTFSERLNQYEISLRRKEN